MKRSRSVPWAALITLALVAPEAQGQVAHRAWITESTVTFGRDGGSPPNDAFLARILAIGDVGLRWSYPSGRSLGLSLAAGYDVPNEATLGGLRGRAALECERTRLEGSLGLFASSAGEGGTGAVLGLAYYPIEWVAVVAQVDLLPTAAPDSPPVTGGEPTLEHAELSRDPSP